MKPVLSHLALVVAFGLAPGIPARAAYVFIDNVADFEAIRGNGASVTETFDGEREGLINASRAFNGFTVQVYDSSSGLVFVDDAPYAYGLSGVPGINAFGPVLSTYQLDFAGSRPAHHWLDPGSACTWLLGTLVSTVFAALIALFAVAFLHE